MVRHDAVSSRTTFWRGGGAQRASTRNQDNDNNDDDDDDDDDDETVPRNNQENRPPPYHRDQLALEVFSNIFFYKTRRQADAAREQREALLKNMTVGDVYRKYVAEWPQGKERGMDAFAALIAARISSINSFLDPPRAPVKGNADEMMNRINLVPLRDAAGTLDADESTTLSFKFTSPMPEYDELAKAANVFDHVYFYKSEKVRMDYRTDREDALGNMTVKEVYFHYTTVLTNDVPYRIPKGKH